MRNIQNLTGHLINATLLELDQVEWRITLRSLSLLSGGAVALALSTSSLSAAVVYDEGVSGDATPAGFTSLTDPFVAFDLGVLASGQNVVIGSVEGGSDTLDVFRFEATGAWTIDILSYSPGASNTASGFGLYASMPASFSDVLSGVQVNGPVNGLFSGGAGVFGIAVNEYGSTSPASYSFAVNIPTAVVPLPAGLPLLLVGLGGLGMLARRRRKSS